MLTESVILALMVVVMWYFTLRSGRRGIAFALLPLLVVPCANVIAAALAPRLDLLSDALGARHWQVLFVLVVTMAWVGAISRNIRRKGPRRAYLFVCGGFSLLFSFLILVDVLPSL